MMRELFPDLPDDALAELRSLAFPVIGPEAAEERQKALERRVEELIVEHGWDHLRVAE